MTTQSRERQHNLERERESDLIVKKLSFVTPWSIKTIGTTDCVSDSPQEVLATHSFIHCQIDHTLSLGREGSKK